MVDSDPAAVAFDGIQKTVCGDRVNNLKNRVVTVFLKYCNPRREGLKIKQVAKNWAVVVPKKHAFAP